MSRLDEGFPPPTACVQWCQHRSYDLHVLDDGVEVDLDWWNGHLDKAGHDLRLRGRNLDGAIVEYGGATVQRNDLRIGTDLAVGEHDSLGLLFLCAAWQGSHRHRRAMRRFPDVINPHLSRPDENPVAKTLAVLDSCVRNRAVPDHPSSTWSGWPDAPGVGMSLMATFLWAVKGVGLRRPGAADRPIRSVDPHSRRVARRPVRHRIHASPLRPPRRTHHRLGHRHRHQPRTRRNVARAALERPTERSTTRSLRRTHVVLNGSAHPRVAELRISFYGYP